MPATVDLEAGAVSDAKVAKPQPPSLEHDGVLGVRPDSSAGPAMLTFSDHPAINTLFLFPFLFLAHIHLQHLYF